MRSYILLFILLLFSFPLYSAENDFDKVCSYFEKLDIELARTKMTKSQKANFINKLVNSELKLNSSARKSWEVIVYAVPEERYDIYQITAVELLKSSWKCDAMKKLIVTTGE